MTTICVCGQNLDDLEFDEECPTCLLEKRYEEMERRDRERKEDLLLGVGQADYDRMVVGLLVNLPHDK